MATSGMELSTSSCDDSLELCDLPDSLLLEIFSFLGAEQLGVLACTSQRFSRVVKDDLLWRSLFYRHYKIPLEVPIHPRAATWQDEYERLHDQTPSVLCEKIKKHKDQVLHVSFSHNGKMFATSSKDGRIMVWNADYPCTERFTAHMTKDFSWRYTQYSQFNKTDTLLLVSGVHYGNMNTSGEIAVFDLNTHEPQCRVVNKPYDVFGTWYDDQHLLSGTLYWTGHLNSISALWLNKASQAIESERESVMMCLYRFQNVNASSIRTIMVAECPMSNSSAAADGSTVCQKCGKQEYSPGASQPPNSENLNANNNSVCDDVSRLDVNHHVDMEWADDDVVDNSRDCYFCCRKQEGEGDTDENLVDSTCDMNSPGKEDAQTVQGCSASESSRRRHQCQLHAHSPPKCPRRQEDCPQVGSSQQESGSASVSVPTDQWCCCVKVPTKKPQTRSVTQSEKTQKASSSTASKVPQPAPAASTSSPRAVASTASDPLPARHSVPCVSGSIEANLKKPESTEKLLIFTMGEQTYTPHLIGIKRMHLQDVLGKRGENDATDRTDDARLLPDVDENLQGMNRPKDKVDHVINMHGHIVGMALSPDHRYLYVNSRQWPPNYTIQKVLEPPPIAQEIDIHVIDLQTLTEVGTIMRSHKAFTPNDECFFLFLDISDHYVASGAEDKHGYLWDRHYGVCLNRFPHKDVVNSVAFNPQDEEMLVTVSDDFTIKIWRSRRRMRQYGLSPAPPDSPPPAQ